MNIVNTTPSFIEALRKAVWLQRLISSFLLVETLAIAGVGWFLSGRTPVEAQPLLLLAALGLLCIALTFLAPSLVRQFLEKTFIRQQPATPEDVLKICQGGAIAMLALRTTPGVLSLPLMLLSGEPLWGMAAAAWAIVTLLQHWPNEERFSGFVLTQMRRFMV